MVVFLLTKDGPVDRGLLRGWVGFACLKSIDSAESSNLRRWIDKETGDHPRLEGGAAVPLRRPPDLTPTHHPNPIPP